MGILGPLLQYKLPQSFTSHASLAYRKQLHPQRTVGIIGSVWQESTTSKEIMGPAQTNTQSTKDHQEGHPLDPNQLTTCEGRLTKTWRLDSLWWCIAESRTKRLKEKEWMFMTKPGFLLATGKNPLPVSAMRFCHVLV